MDSSYSQKLAPRYGRIRFTLRELFVVITILCGLLTLSLPAINASRETARRISCCNNTKQLVLGLQNYHDTFLHLPSGARHRTTLPDNQPSVGSSWLIAITPFCKATPLFDKVIAADQGGSDYIGSGVRSQANRLKIDYMLCPSSPLPGTERLSGFKLVVSSYAGVMGATDFNSSDYQTRTVDELGRIVPGPYEGLAAANGMLPINESLTIADCKDGMANTIIVGEVSAWYYDDQGTQHNPALSYAGASAAPRIVAGWLAGTDLDFKIRQDSPPVPADRIGNLITIRYAINVNNRSGSKDAHPNWNTAGIGPRGLNNPLLSAHPIGAVVGYLDGHSSTIRPETHEYILRRLTMRDDCPPLVEWD